MLNFNSPDKEMNNIKRIDKSIDKSQNKPEFLTVAGDNYYFLKNKKKDVGEEQKIFNQEV